MADNTSPPPQRPPKRTALAAARRAAAGQAPTSWEAGSRFGPFGRLARRLLRRVLKPYDVRQREVDAALVAAIDEQTGPLRGDADRIPPAISGIATVEVDTPIGSFLLDANDDLLRPALEAQKSWSYDIATLLERSLAPGMRFLDVGANIGYFSVLASRLVGETGTVVAVEPDPVNLQLLRANLWRCGCANARVLPLAADARRGHTSLVTFPEGGAATETTRDASRYEQDARVEVEDIGKVLVPTAPLDDLVTGPLDVIKLDTQFTEHDVVEGLEQTLAISPDVLIVTEFGPKEVRRRGVDPLAVLRRYEELGFGIRVLRANEEVEISLPAIVSAPDEMPLGNGPFFDLVLRKGSWRDPGA